MKRLGYALSAAALCSLAIGPGFALAAEGAAAPTGKEETVHVRANADGSVREEKVSVVLRNGDGAATLADASDLEDLKPDDEDFSFTEHGGEIEWSAHGDDVAYSGTTKAALPVTVSASYTLDGEPISPDQLAGKSGKVKIRYDYRNESSVDVNGKSLYTPFTAITAVMLDGDSFSNVAVTNAKIVNDGDTVIVVGYAAPGLKESLGTAAEDADIPDYVEIEADASDFEMKSALTMVSAGLMEDIDLSSVDSSELSDASSGLSEATSALVDGTDELASGLGELASGTEGMSDAARQLSTGAQAASGSLPEMVSAIDALDQGAKELSAGAAKLGDATSSLEDNVGQAQQACQAIESVLASMSTSLEAVKANNASAEAAVKAAAADADVPAGTRAQLEQALAAMQANDRYLDGLSAPGTTTAALQQATAAVEGLGAGLDPAGAAALSAGAASVKEGASSLASGLDALARGTGPLVSGVNQLVKGTGQLAAGASKLSEGARAAADGSTTLAEGMRAYSDEAIGEIVDVIDNKVVNLVDRMDALKQASRDYDNFSGKVPGTPSSVRFVIEVDPV